MTLARLSVVVAALVGSSCAPPGPRVPRAGVFDERFGDPYAHVLLPARARAPTTSIRLDVALVARCRLASDSIEIDPASAWLSQAALDQLDGVARCVAIGAAAGGGLAFVGQLRAEHSVVMFLRARGLAYARLVLVSRERSGASTVMLRLHGDRPTGNRY